MEKQTGRCMCGKVQYAFTGETYGVISCHCKECQQLHGNYNPMLVVNKNEFTFMKDEGIAWYESSTEKHRGFCKHCGAALLMLQVTGPKMLISVGSLDDTTDLTNVKNVFTDDAGSYYVMPPEAA